jgi:dimethylhistidine N-methyltransferase
MQAQHLAIAQGLLATAAHISPKYFYDAVGSGLFEQITQLPEYYPTRTEREIMDTCGADIAKNIGPGTTVVELGAGNCEKAHQLCALLAPAHFVAIDISTDHLHTSTAQLQAALPSVQVHTIAADLTADIALPQTLPSAKRVVFYPGSSIGNFDAIQAQELLARARRMVAEDGALLIGVDLRKDVAVLEAAYNDAQGVTAAFNLNMLTHLNHLIGSDFDVQQWQHVAFFNSAASRIEMHLQAKANTTVRWPGAQRSFSRGERIHTEHSYKYTVESFADLLERAGWTHAQTWSDARGWFAVVLARP